MSCTQRYTADGVALHAGELRGCPESHNCMHLPSAFARLLSEGVPVGITGMVADARAHPPDGAAHWTAVGVMATSSRNVLAGHRRTGPRMHDRCRDGDPLFVARGLTAAG